jgi:hypothetical protein
VDPDRFFTDELPHLAREREALVAAGARELAPRALTVEIGDRRWALRFEDPHVTVTEAAMTTPAVVRLDAEDLADLVHDLRTPMGLFTGGDLDMPAGRLDDVLDWWVVLRGLLDARPVHTAGSVRFADRDGSPLDLTRAFRTDDDPADMGHFLAEAGFLHIEGVFTEEEMAAVCAEMDAAAAGYERGDGRSWWARTGDGIDRLVRMQYFHQRSPTTRALLADDRLLGLGRLTSDGHVHGKPGSNANLVEALVKPIDVVEGISDVPWHKDCSLGSHSYRCCSLTAGISVTGADERSGQLRVVAGSHRALIQPAFVRRGLDLPQLDLPTRTGDLTVHLSCTLHMSQPPVDRERRVLYTDFRLPSDEPDPGEAKLRRIRDAAPTTVSQPRSDS